jgi:DedD protein
MGYDPIIETTATAGTPIHRVRLQPMSDRTKLEQTADSLSKKLNLSTQILQHKP